MAFLDSLGASAPVVLMGAGIVVLIWVLLRRSHRRLGRRPTNEPMLVRTPRPGDTRSVSAQCRPDDIARWEVQMHETARDLSAQLDSKTSALQALVRDADRAAARLEAAREGLSPEEASGRTAEDCRVQIEQLGEYGFSAAEIGRWLGLPPMEVGRVLSASDASSDD